MLELQKRFEAQRQKLLKEGPKDSHRATPPLPWETVEAGVKMLESFKAKAMTKDAKTPEGR